MHIISSMYCAAKQIEPLKQNKTKQTGMNKTNICTNNTRKRTYISEIKKYDRETTKYQPGSVVKKEKGGLFCSITSTS